MKIETDVIHPFALCWSAWDADTYDGAEDSRQRIEGRGASERWAINDLVEQLMEQQYEQGFKDGMAHEREAAR